METRNLAIMFVDLAGYTLRTSLTTREDFIALLDTYKSLSQPIFTEYGGTIVKEIGDAFMVSFESPTNAVLCGVALQNTMLMHNKQQPKKNHLHIKVAISSGEVHIKDNDLYGEAVNIASRIEKITKVGRIYFTEAIFLAMNKKEVSIGFVGERKLRGVPRKVKIYTVLGKYDKIMIKTRKQKKKLVNAINKFLLILFILIMLGLAVGIAIFLILSQGKLF
jgi:class 3 adenylate cyclase